jgi:hypothetical protein
VVTARNVGSKSTEAAFVLSDTLPVGITMRRVQLFWPALGTFLQERLPGLSLDKESDLFPFLKERGFCSETPLRCSSETGGFTLPVGVVPDEAVKVIVDVTVNPGASGELVNAAAVSGGGGRPVSMEVGNVVSSVPAAFGPANFSSYVTGLDGAPDTQAGDHPYELTATIGFDNAFRARSPESTSTTTSVQDVKDVIVNLPLGFVGSTLATPKCTLEQLSADAHCPTDTIIGYLSTEPVGTASIESPIYNLVPEHGVPAEFGYYDRLKGSHVFYSQVVPTPKGYVLQTTNPDIPAVNLAHVTATFYGDPAARQEELALREGKTASPIPQVPFFTNPTDCSGEPLVSTIYMDSWQNPARMNPDGTPVNLQEPAWAKMESASPPVSGCNGLRFPAEIQAQPTTHEADKPSGMDFEIKLPQAETMSVPATPTLKKVVTRLPEGLTVDPSAGDGLAACSEAQIGWEEGLPGPVKFNAAPPVCPEASKIGFLELETPLVASRFEGELFIARQNENPFHATLAAYVVVDDPITGVLIKIAGKFVTNPVTGQLTAEFDENPNLPFSDLKLHFFGGPRAELATPESCGTFTISTELFPYSAPDSGPPATPFDNFLINEACPTGGFNPQFKALSSNVQAGAYTPFEASFSRSDTDQELAGLTVTLPAGLVGKIAGIPLCTDTEIHAAEEGTGGCPEASQVGKVKAGAGPGPDPLFVAGKAYLTGPYNGGPYGLAVVVPAVAGPFDFGTVVVRQSIRIDPRTARVTDVSDAFPTIIDGIPLRLRRVDVILDRPQFTFNPTSCEHEAFTGSISGSPLGAPRSLKGTVGYATQSGATAPITAPFQVTDCAGLKFSPRFEASTKARPSRADGASLTVKLSYPSEPWGSQANVGRVKVSLPRQLPSRLKTLQKACTASQFNANPAGCPAASIVGHAIVHTPVLPAPLEGPAYFVSNGGQAFPNLIMVLQGDNVSVQLVGDTFISKKGITSSTFNNVPDVPFSTFQLTLPQGAYSALAANLPHAGGSFCGQTLKMPTEFHAQNGMVTRQTTKIAVTGCKKARRASHHKHGARGRKA